MSARPLTDQQRRVFRFVTDFVHQHGFPPTLREIGDAVGLANINAVRGHLGALEKKGYITKMPDKSRTIRITEQASGAIEAGWGAIEQASGAIEAGSGAIEEGSGAIEEGSGVVQEGSRLSRVKRRVHEWLRTDEGVIHEVVYGVGWCTWQRTPWLTVARRERLEAALEREAAEHGWLLLETRMEPDHVVVVVEAWPNHSARRVVRHLQRAGRAIDLAHESLAGKPLWDRGFVATTDLDSLDEMVRQLLGAPPSPAAAPAETPDTPQVPLNED